MTDMYDSWRSVKSCRNCLPAAGPDSAPGCP
ncbi:hypothetical protein R2601_03073 [Salipiger bermudensis HTCC2601]|uniref:Uncharacterized protein n=1 Tax=Salipiger bermudensis (strain DSM 26914 / JCM 13377 / KCTC 12554 / HTCC2601) TaxID=314265 RepID=Q0FWN1_SALBH|nr:hypothetical protein R2601_03073 [Salipiger bermudensis HTCC2601]